MPLDNIDEIRENFDRRGITPEHVLFISVLRGLVKAGVLNQGILKISSSEASKLLMVELKARNVIPEGSNDREKFKDFVKKFVNHFEICDNVEFSEEGDIITVGFGGDSCRYCLKHVGYAEILGSLCPFPMLLEQCAKNFGIDVTLLGSKPEKKNELCWFSYRIGGD